MSKELTYGMLVDDAKLRKLILENPDLPIMYMVGDEANNGEFNYEKADVINIEVCEMAEYTNGAWLDKELYEDALYRSFGRSNRNDGIVDAIIDNFVADTMSKTEFIKAIVIFIG